MEKSELAYLTDIIAKIRDEHLWNLPEMDEHQGELIACPESCLHYTSDYITKLKGENKRMKEALEKIEHECEISMTPDNVIWEFSRDGLKTK